ncbi:MAG: CvpA family protein [Zetaproteobacteria bacterium]|nr:CvpA family protein [Zetaproteobacteria bacterium]
MNFFDYILIGLVGLSMVLSLWRGFIREMISLIGLVAAFLLASRTSGYAGDFLSQWLPNSTMADMAGFVLVFVLVMLAVGIVGVIVRKIIDMADLTATDRTLGVFFGVARGFLLIAVSFLIYTSYSSAKPDWLKQSLLAPYAVQMGDLLGQVIPKEYPFSRAGGAKLRSPQLSKVIHSIQDMSTGDKESIKDIIQQHTK